MKKVVVFLGLLSALSLKAETFERTLVTDYIPVAGMDYSYELKTEKFDRVILDCQSFITGMNFYRSNKLAHGFYLDAYSDCPEMHNFITESRAANKAVCLEIDYESNSLTASNDSDCQ